MFDRNWMRKSVVSILFAGLAAGVGQAQPQMITITAAAQSWLTPDLLADLLIDQNSPISLVPNSATLAINNQDHPSASTDLRAVGLFANGNVAAGTSMQDPVDPTAVFAG